MEKYEIKRTASALNDLKEIVLYIAVRNSAEVAYKIIDEIEKAVMRLETLPHSGSPERFLYSKKTGYRYLVVKNYLIHYHIDGLVVYIDRIRYGLIAPDNQI